MLFHFSNQLALSTHTLASNLDQPLCAFVENNEKIFVQSRQWKHEKRFIKVSFN